MEQIKTMSASQKVSADIMPPASSQGLEYIDVEKMVPRVLNQRYVLKQELGRGAHGCIYSGKDKTTKQPIAVKVMEKITKNKSKYVREISLMKDMNKTQQVGFPKLINHFVDKQNYYIIMEQLGYSLKDIKEQCEEQKFSIKTVTIIGLQTLYRLESMHKLNYIHRDLKPANIMIGRNKHDQHLIYLIDYGLSKKQNQISQIAQNDKGSKVVGTAIYAGINAHMPGQNYYKKDDLESLMYVLCYLNTGYLPWKNCKMTDQGLDKMMRMKIKISPFELFKAMPIEFAQIYDHIRTTPGETNCDYRYIETMFKAVAQNQKFKINDKNYILQEKLNEKFLKEAFNVIKRESGNLIGLNGTMLSNNLAQLAQMVNNETAAADKKQIDIKVTVNFQNSQPDQQCPQIDKQDQSNRVAMTINHNFMVHIQSYDNNNQNGNTFQQQVSQQNVINTQNNSIPQITISAVASTPNGNVVIAQNALEENKECLSVDPQQCLQVQEYNSNPNEENKISESEDANCQNSLTYEEFENGINLEFQIGEGDDSEGVKDVVSPLHFTPHSNITKFKNMGDINSSQHEKDSSQIADKSQFLS